MAFYKCLDKDCIQRGELVLYTHFECDLISRIGCMQMCCSFSLTGDLPSAVWPAGLAPHVFVCCGSSLTGDLPSAVWPAGLAPHVFVCCGSSLTGDLPSAVWPAGFAPHVFVCCGSSLTGDLPSAVWPAGLALHVFVCCGSSLTDRCQCFANLMLILLALPVVSRHHSFLESSQRLERSRKPDMHAETNQKFVIYTNLYHKVHLSTVCMLPSASSSVSTALSALQG